MFKRPARASLAPRAAAAAPPAPALPRPAADAAQRPRDGLLRPDAVAGRLGVAKATHATWRGTGAGPAFVRLSHKTVRYQAAAVEKFIANETVQNLGVNKASKEPQCQGRYGRSGLDGRDAIECHRCADRSKWHGPVVHPQVLDGLVGDGDTVGVAREIGEHGLWSAEWSLGVDHPPHPPSRR